ASRSAYGSTNPLLRRPCVDCAFFPPADARGFFAGVGGGSGIQGGRRRLPPVPFRFPPSRPAPPWDLPLRGLRPPPRFPLALDMARCYTPSAEPVAGPLTTGAPHRNIRAPPAQVAELVDALVSGTSG